MNGKGFYPPFPQRRNALDRAAVRWPGLLLTALAKDRKNFVRRFCLGQALPDTSIVQKLGDRGESAQVGLKLVLGDDEEDHKFYRRVVQRIEFNPGRRTAKRGND